MEYQFEIPKHTTDLSSQAYTALAFSKLAARLAAEKRTLVNHPDGSPESVAEHSFMLSIVAPIIANQLYPKLDSNLAARFATIHDIIEAYVGDTPTLYIDTTGLQNKEDLEKLGLVKLLEEYNAYPEFTALVFDYEAQITPEARFVRILDKCMPILVHFIDAGATLRSYTTSAQHISNSKIRSDTLRLEYPDFMELLDLRDELTERSSELF